MKILFGISDHSLHHLAADAARFARSQIAVIALLQVDIQRRSDFALEGLQLVLGIGRRVAVAVACHVFHLLVGFDTLNFCKVRKNMNGKICNSSMKTFLNDPVKWCIIN